MTLTVGIDDLNVYPSTLLVDAADIAAARGWSKEEANRQEVTCRSLPPAFEDPISLAVNAARPVVEDAGPGGVELLVVATESSVDYGKPLSSYVHRHLGMHPRCRNLEMKHACYAGTAAVQLASAWVRANPGKKALVIMTDMVRRTFGAAAELALGAAAVAVVVAANPRILALEPLNAYVSREIYDVSRPNGILERANPGLSLAAYLDLLEAAIADFQRIAGTASLDTFFDYVIYHMPLLPLVRRAHRLLLEAGKRTISTDEANASFERMVRPSTVYCQQMGNVYSGSLYAGLAGLVDTAPSLQPGARVGFYSYGSGSCAELFSGIVGEEARETVARRHIGQALASRRKVNINDYEQIVIEHEKSLALPNFQPDRTLVPGHYDEVYCGNRLLVLDRVSDYYRSYSWS